MGTKPQWLYHFGSFPYLECLDQRKEHQEVYRGTDKGESRASRELMEKESEASWDLVERLITKLSDQHESITKILSEIAKSAG